MINPATPARTCRLHGPQCTGNPRETHQYGPAREVDDTARQVYADQARQALADFDAIDYTTITEIDLCMMLGRLAQTTRFLLKVVDGGQQ